jgi:hypothetical protein
VQQTIVREYKSRQAFEKDAEKLAADGYSVVSVTDSQQRSGCLRMLTLGFFALIWRPKNRLIVTYQRSAPSP